HFRMGPRRQKSADPIAHRLLARRDGRRFDQDLEDAETPPLATGARRVSVSHADQDPGRKAGERQMTGAASADHRSSSAIAFSSVARATTSWASMVSPGVPAYCTGTPIGSTSVLPRKAPWSPSVP